MKPVFTITLVIGAIFSLVGALMAYVIAYEEYSHHYADKKKPFHHAMQTAIFTFCVFLVLSIIVGFSLNRLFKS